MYRQAAMACALDLYNKNGCGKLREESFAENHQIRDGKTELIKEDANAGNVPLKTAESNWGS